MEGESAGVAVRSGGPEGQCLPWENMTVSTKSVVGHSLVLLLCLPPGLAPDLLSLEGLPCLPKSGQAWTEGLSTHVCV